MSHPGGDRYRGFHPPRYLFLVAVILLAVLAVGACTSRRPQPVGGREAGSSAFGGPVKVFTTEAGVYELTAADLAPFGLDREPGALRLFWRGRPQPLWVAGEGQDLRVRFYARASESRYSRESVYWLQAGGGPARWMEAGDAAPGQGPVEDLGLSLVHLEQNLRYSPQVEAGDHFFWSVLAAPGEQSFDFSLDQLAAGAGELQLEVWASTEAPPDPDHRLQVSLNGQTLADETWDGQGRHTLTAAIPDGLLREEDNQVQVTLPGLEGVAADVLFLDWVEVRYPRRLVARAGRLAFEGHGAPLALSGFRGPVAVFEVSDPQAVSRVEPPAEGGTVIFAGRAGGQYLAVEPGGYWRPARLAPVQFDPDLRAPGLGADYVAVGPPELLTALQPLLDWRAQGGLQVMAVPLAAVYDQFNDGFPEPEAIQALMRHAAAAWDPAPRYLLLVGDSSYDPQGYLAPAQAAIPFDTPTFLVNTVYGGETGSDVPFGQVDDDLWPEIAVGRIPARDPGQVRVVVDKVLAYEGQSNLGAWARRVLAVADGTSSSFSQEAQRFLDRFGEAAEGELYAPAAGAPDPARDLLARMQEGAWLVAYFGHGSLSQWGKDDILTTEDVPGLRNGDRLPVVVNMTCLTGLFTHPERDSLAESLLWQRGGGAVAVLAPTSLTLPSDQSFLSDALADALLAEGPLTLGEVSLRARRQVDPATPGGRDVLLTFLLFGDPALRLPSGR